MTLFDVQRLSNHWRQFPPLRILVAMCASALGVKLPITEDSKDKKYMSADEARVALNVFNVINRG